MTRPGLSITLLSEPLAVVRLDPRAPLPKPPAGATFWALTLTSREASVVCDELTADRLGGPLDFSLSGVLSRLLAPLAAAQIPVFVISTFDTDYILVRAWHIRQAVDVLAPHCRVEPPRLR